MWRSSSVASVLAGIVLMGVVLATFVVDIGEHDVAEGIGILAFLIGLFFLWEGVFSLWRSHRLDAARDKPK